eukprot:TRINITY_DN6396_c0_g1_i1.p1 TRINITY_DN6396_c0_g1~~TRINITY_DN6396_c0_g1_i1.p1  ORF type:complete len:716 (+),score=137.38 TRINITY_DN6396_c0_g1_i1:51-2198(+)
MDNYAHFVRLLATDAITVRALTEVVDPAECGKLATSLVAIGVQTDSIQAILRAIISAEFSNTQHAETVMRAGSCSTKMIADYLNRIASKYLQFTLQDTVSSVIGRSDLNLEVDPDKLGPGESLEGQQHLLQQTAEEFVSRIVSAEAFDAMPMEMKLLAAHIGTLSQQKFPDSVQAHVGGLIMLRFFNPAILSPDAAKLTPLPITTRIRRNMVLVTKLLQNLANGVQFDGYKERFMMAMNKFLLANSERMNAYLTRLADLPDPESRPVSPRDFGRRESVLTVADVSAIGQEPLVNLHRIVERTLNKFKVRCVDLWTTQFGVDEAARRSIMLLDALKELGPAPKRASASANTTITQQQQQQQQLGASTTTTAAVTTTAAIGDGIGSTTAAAGSSGSQVLTSGHVLVSLTWSTTTAVDLDVCALACNERGELLDAAYYNRLRALGGCIRHFGDNVMGDDDTTMEQIEVKISSLPSEVHDVFFLITSNATGGFKEVESATIQVYNIDATQQHLAYQLGNVTVTTLGDHTALLAASLHFNGTTMSTATAAAATEGHSLHSHHHHHGQWELVSIGLPGPGRNLAESFPTLVGQYLHTAALPAVPRGFVTVKPMRRTFSLRVVQGRHIKAMDIGGTSDPYCVLEYGRVQHQTDVVKRTVCPVWHNPGTMMVSVTRPAELDYHEGIFVLLNLMIWLLCFYAMAIAFACVLSVLLVACCVLALL